MTDIERHRVDYRTAGMNYTVMCHFTSAESAREAVRDLRRGDLAWYRVSRLSADGMRWTVVEEELVERRRNAERRSADAT